MKERSEAIAYVKLKLSIQKRVDEIVVG